MKTFVETTEFSRWQPRFLPGDAYAELQQELVANIYGKGEKGDLTPAEKKDLRELAREYKRLVVEAARKVGKEQDL